MTSTPTAPEAATVTAVADEVLRRLKHVLANSPNRSIRADVDQIAAEFGVAWGVPSKLPTEPGHYLDKHDDWAYLAADGAWTDSFTYGVEPSVIASRAPLARVRPVAEVAAEVLAEIRAVSRGDGGWYEHQLFERELRDIEAKFGVTS